MRAPLVCALLALLATPAAATMYPGRARCLWLPVLTSPDGLADCRYTCRTFGMEVVYTPWPNPNVPLSNVLCGVREVSRLFSGALRILYTAAGQPTARCQAVVDRSESEVAALTTYVADGSAQHPFWCGCSPVDRRVLPPASPTFNWTAVGLDCAPGKARDFHICWVQDGKQQWIGWEATRNVTLGPECRVVSPPNVKALGYGTAQILYLRQPNDPTNPAHRHLCIPQDFSYAYMDGAAPA